MDNSLPIGMFDSGVGGLTVLREAMRQLPGESLLYFGDTARVPYGSKSREVITRYALEIGQFLIHEQVKLLLVACNTASAYALPALSGRFSVPVVGVIDPGARAALRATRTGRIGVIGTEGTIDSQAYGEAIRRQDPKAEVFGQPCPLIVPLVEEGWLDKPVTGEIVKEYLSPLLAKKIDTLVLGCTHYPLLKGLLAKVAGRGVTLIDSAEETARVVGERLRQDGLAADGGGETYYRFYVSDAPEKFARVGARFLDSPIPHVQRVDIGTWA